MDPMPMTDDEKAALPPHDVIHWALHQPQYRPLSSVRLIGPRGRTVSHWTFTDEERVAIAAGADLFLEQLTFNTDLQPILPTIGLRDFCSQDV